MERDRRLTLAGAVDSIAAWAFCDTSANLDRKALREVLQLDIDTGSPLPTEAECETLICGEEGSEDVKRLIKLYPVTDQWLTGQLT